MSPLRGSRRGVPRRFLVPEVVQTSSMDCGPAALKALAEGFSIPVSYGRLREACHTDLDGTSIDTLEEIARSLKLEAEQIMIPIDHVLLDESRTLPAIAVVQRATGGAHFVVLWRRHGHLLQVMDPARGRLWISARTFLNQLYRHTTVVSASDWRTWAGTEAFLAPLTQRLKRAGVPAADTRSWVMWATADPSWKRLAELDAAARLVGDLIEASAIRNQGSAAVLNGLLTPATAASTAIPEQCWSVRPVEGAPEVTRLRMRGAVLVRVTGRNAATTDVELRSPEIVAALAERPANPLQEMGRALRASGLTVPLLALAAGGIATLGVVFEALLLRSLLEARALLPLPVQALGAAGALALFSLLLLGVELVLASAERRAGSHLEARLRMAFLEKLPRLTDSYFQSRPISDMLERSHVVHVLRMLPPLAVRTLRIAAELFVTTAAIIWLDPRMAPIALTAFALAAACPFLAGSFMAERDMKVRTHGGALARFHLDALLGRTAIEAHGADVTVEREHDRLLSEWVHAGRALQRGSIAIEGIQMTIGFALAAWILFSHFAGGVTGAMLLMTYWVLNLPALGYELALNLREYPAHRNVILRLLEPLGARESTDDAASSETRSADRDSSGTRIEMRDVSVRIAGHQVLESVDFEVAPGAHVAIVGASGAGKSSLVGLLLGWHRVSSGEMLVDGVPPSAAHLDRLRRETAWVDPGVQIWNRSLLDNLLYGSERSAQSVAPVLEAAGLLQVVARLPQGLATPLGEGGGLLSAGERQRVRLGRAMMRDRARLVVLDEPFLGLEKERRRALLAQVRQRWAGRTLLYVTHDIAETRGFDRIVVMDRGRLIEDGEPLQLAQIPASRYRRLLQAQETVHARLTTGAEWRRIRLEAGRISHELGNASLEQRA